MIDATILVPTFRHAAFIPYALRSALDQDGAEVEVFVVGDGVEDDTRAALEPFLTDSRVRFFDFPKGERHGEAHRHEVLREATGRIVCYLSDDDLLLPDHVAEMTRLLENADFAHSAPAYLDRSAELVYMSWDLSRPEFAELMRAGKNAIGLTGAAHTLEAYRRLPHGWCTAPDGVATDRYMWLQWLDLPEFRGVTSEQLTHLHFPEQKWLRFTDEERAAALAEWLRRSREPGFAEELGSMLQAAIRRAGEDFRIRAREAELTLEAIQGTRTWRVRRRLAELRPLRALRGRRREGR